MKKTIATIIITLVAVSNMLPGTLIGEYRNPLTLVAWNTGIATDNAGNGLLTSPYTDSYYNYIGYKPGTPEGTKVFTIEIYNPVTLYGDDIIARFDF